MDRLVLFEVDEFKRWYTFVDRNVLTSLILVRGLDNTGLRKKSFQNSKTHFCLVVNIENLCSGIFVPLNES